jgi:hypothetical protein
LFARTLPRITARRPKRRISRSTVQRATIPRRDDLQNLADRLDPKGAAVLIDEILQNLIQRSSSACAKNALASFDIPLARRSP